MNIAEKLRGNPLLSPITQREKRRYGVSYTLIFCVVCLIVFSGYLIAGKTLIWNTDGWNQHYKALYFYRGWLCDGIRQFFATGQLAFPTYNFALGQGGDIIQSLNFYVVGDPFALLSVLCPVQFLPFFYGFLIWLRFYLAGLSFSALCLYKRQYSQFAVLAGTLSYLFCAWGITNAVRHPYFMNPMIFFPLIILGLEKIFAKEKPYWFIVGVFFTAISNFYFFYVTVLAVVIFFTVRWNTVYIRGHRYRAGIRCFIKVFVFSLLAVCAAGVLLLPSLYTFLSDSRMSSATASTSLLYPLGYYAKMISGWVKTGAGYKLYLGYSVAFLPCLLLLFAKRRRHSDLKVLFVIGFVLMCFPIFGEIFNGFSYASNRWSFSFALLTSYIIVVMWRKLFSLSRKEKLFILLLCGLYGAVCLLLDYSSKWALFSALLLCAAFLGCILPYRKRYAEHHLRRKQSIAFLLVIFGIINMAFWQYSNAGDHAIRDSVPFKTADSVDAGVGTAIRSAAADDDTFYRFAGTTLSDNVGLVAGLSSTHSFWSLSNAAVSDLCTRMGILETRTQIQKSFDRRETLLSLSAVKYFTVPTDGQFFIPYGFEATETESEQWKVYKNQYALPLGYTYDSVLSAEDFDALSPVGKEEAMLQSVLIEDYNGHIKAATPQSAISEVGYTLQCNNRHATLQNGRFVVTKGKTCVTLALNTPTDDNVYVLFEGLDFAYSSQYDLYYGSDEVDPLHLYNADQAEHDSFEKKTERWRKKIYDIQPSYTTLQLTTDSGVSQSFKYFTPYDSYYTDVHDYTVPLGVHENGVQTITIEFERPGIYSFDSLRVVSRSMERYAGDIQNRKADTLQHVEMGNNTVRGTITTETDKILCLSLPYSAGWTATVDGKEVPLYRANVMHMALEIGAGEHTVELHYQTPLLKEGALLSLVGIVLLPLILFVALPLLRKRRVR